MAKKDYDTLIERKSPYDTPIKRNKAAVEADIKLDRATGRGYDTMSVEGFARETGRDFEQYEEQLYMQALVESELRERKKQQEAEDAYQDELAILKMESEQRNWFQNLAQGAYVSSKFDNYLEMPDGTLIIDDNYLPGLSSDINLTKGTYGSGWRKATPAEKKEYETYKKRLMAGYHESPGFRLGAASEELGDGIIDGLVDFALDLPLIAEAAGKPLLRRELGLAIEDMVLSVDESGARASLDESLMQTLTDRRKDLTNRQNQLQKEKQDAFDKMSEEEKKKYLESNGRWSYTMGRMNDISRADKQKEIRSQILQKAAELEGRDVKRFFNPNEVDPVSKEMISWQRSYVDADGVTRYQDEQVRYEIPGADGNPWNTQQLVMNIDDTPALDDEGNYIYKDKYPLAAKYGNALGNSDLIFDKYGNDMVWDGASSAISFFGVGFGTGAVLKAITKGITKGIVKGITKTMETAITKGIIKGIEKGASLESKLATIAKWTDKAGQAISSVADSYLMTNSESQTLGSIAFNNVYKAVLEKKAGVDRELLYQKFSAKGLTGQELENAVNKEVAIAVTNLIYYEPEAEADAIGIAMAARRNAVTTNNVNTLLNLNYGKYFTKGASLAKSFKPRWSPSNIIGTSAYLLKEAGQEYIEEGIMNQYAQMSSETLGRGVLERRELTKKFKAQGLSGKKLDDAVRKAQTQRPMSFADYLKEGMWSAESIESGILGAILGFGQSAVMESLGTIQNRGRYKNQKEYINENLNKILKYSKDDVNKYLTNVLTGQQFAESAQRIDQALKNNRPEEAQVIAENMMLQTSINSAVLGTSNVLIDNLRRLQMSENMDAEDKAAIQRAIDFADMTADIYDGNINKAEGAKLTSLIMNSKVEQDVIDTLKTQRLTEINGQIDKYLAETGKETIEDSHELAQAKKKIEAQIEFHEELKKSLIDEYNHLNSPKGQEEAIKKIKRAKKAQKLSRINKKNFKETTDKVKQETGEDLSPEEHAEAVRKAKENDEKTDSQETSNPTAKETEASGNPTTRETPEAMEATETTSIPTFTIQELEAGEAGPMDALLDEEAKKRKIKRDAEKRVLGQPIPLNKNMPTHKSKVEEFTEGINRISDRANSNGVPITFNTAVYWVATRRGNETAEAAFEFIKEAYKKSKAYKGETEQDFDTIYKNWFGNDFLSKKQVVSQPQSAQETAPIVQQEAADALKTDKRNPPTPKNTDVFGKVWKSVGMKIAQAVLKIPFLGTHYNTVYDYEDGLVEYKDSNNEEIIVSAIPFLDWYIIKTGDKVFIKVNKNITKADLDQVVSNWKRLDDNSPLFRDDITVRDLLEAALPGQNIEELISKYNLEELINMEIKGKPGATMRDSEILRKYPIDLIHDKMIKEHGREAGKARGVHDYYWWNENNVPNFLSEASEKIEKEFPYLAEENPKEFKEMVEAKAEAMRESLIEEGRKQNIEIREKLIKSKNGELPMVVSMRKSGVSLKNKDNSVDTVANSNPQAILTIVNSKKDTLQSGNKEPIPKRLILNYKEFKEKLVNEKLWGTGLRVMLFPVGTSKNTETGKWETEYQASTLTSTTHTIVDKQFQQQMRESMGNLYKNAELIHRALYNDQDHTLADNIAKEIIAWLTKNPLPGANKFLKDYKTLYPTKFNNEGDFAYDIQQEYLQHNNGKGPLIPIINIANGMANITTMYYEDALKQNLMTQLKFKEIPSASSPTGSIFINDIQPVIVLEEPAGTIASEEKEEVVEKTPKSFSERFQEVAKKTSKTNTKEQQIADIERRKQEELKNPVKTTEGKEETSIYLGERYTIQVFRGAFSTKYSVEVSQKDDTTSTGYKSNESLSKDSFDTYEEALEYANKVARKDKEYQKRINAKYDAELKALEEKANLDKKLEVKAETKAEENLESVDNPNFEKEVVTEEGVKTFSEKDYSFIKDNLFHKTLRKVIPFVAGGKIEITGKSIMEALRASFDETVSFLEDNGAIVEAEYLMDNKEFLLAENGEYMDSVLEDILDTFNMSEDEVDSEEDMNDGGENTTGYDQASYEKSAVLSISQKVKAFFCGIVDENSTEEGFGGLSKYVDPNTVIAGIQKVFSLSPDNSMESFTQVARNLIEKSTNKEGKSPYSFLQTVMDRLEDPTVDESFKKELQYTFYQNPVKMTFVQVEPRTVNGVTIFVVKAMNADSKNEDILKRAEWVNNLKQSPLVDMIDSRTFKIDKNVAERVKYLYEKFLNTENKTEIIPEELSEFFNYFGISLHDTSIEHILSGKEEIVGPATIQELIKGINKTKNGRESASSLMDILYLNMKKSIAKQDNDKTLDIGNYSVDNILLHDNDNYIKMLVILDNFVTFNPALSTYISGKFINSYANPNLITEQIKRLQNPKDTTLVDNLSQASFSKETMIIQMIKEFPELRKMLDIDQVSVSAIKEKGYPVPDRNRIEDLSIRDYFVATFGNFTQTYSKMNGYFRNGIALRVAKMAFPTISDNGTMPLFKTIIYHLTRRNFVDNVLPNEEVKLNREVLNELFGQLVQPEINRIEAFIENQAMVNENIAGLDFKAKLFYIFPSFNSLLVQDHNGNSVTFLDALTSAIRRKKNAEDSAVSDLIESNKDILLQEVNRNIEAISKDLFRVEEGQGKGLLVEQGLFVNGTSGAANGNLENIDTEYLKTKRGDETGVVPLSQAQLAQVFTLDYTINYLVNQQAVQAIFAGDITNYSKAKSDLFVDEDTSIINFGSKTAIKIVGKVKLDTSDYNAGQEYKTAIYNQIAKDTGVNLSKRLKALLSPGNRLAAEQKDYLQVIVQDTDSASEALESLFRTWYPDVMTDELRKELSEFKALDRVYNKTKAQRDIHKNMLDSLQKRFPLIGDYFANKTTDGQEWVTWQNALTQLRDQSRITKENFDNIWAKLEAQSQDLANGGPIKEENKLTKDEMKLALMQPSKPLYSGLHFEKYGDYMSQRFVYVKSSSFPLLPELTTGFMLDNVRKNLEKLQDLNPEKTVRVSFDSAVKSGNFNNPLNIEELYKDVNETDFDLVTDRSIVLSKENFYIQQDKPFKTDKNIKAGKRDEITRGTQPEKIILGNGINKITENIFPNMFDKHILEAVGIPQDQEMISGRDLWNIYNELYRQEQKLLKEQLFEELGIDSYDALSRKEPAVYRKLSSMLNSRLSNKQDKESISIVYQVVNVVPVPGSTDGRTEYINSRTVNQAQLQRLQETEPNLKIINADFKLPLWITPNSRKFEAVLGSIIKNKLTKPKLPGSSSAVASEEGFRIKKMDYEEYIKRYGSEGIIFTDAFDGELKAKRNADGYVTHAQVFLPNKFRGADGQLIDLTKYVKNGVIDNDKLPKELREFFSYRIPTSAHQSGMLIEVVGFLPHTSGDMMVVPKDSTSQIGEDYDIDMRNWYMLNYIVDSEGNIKRLSLEDSISQEEIDKMEEEHKAYKEELKKSISDQKYKLWYNNREHLIELAFLLEEKRMLMKSDPAVVKLVDALLSRASGEVVESDITSELQDVNKRIAELEEVIIPSKTLKSRQGALREDMINILNELDNNFNKAKNADFFRMKDAKKLYHQVLENNIISIYKSVYSSPDTRIDKLISATLNTKFAEKTADLIEDATQNSDKNAPFTLYSPIYQQRVMALGHSGQIGVGVHSDWVVFNSLVQQVSSEDNPIQLIGVTEEGETYPFHMKFGVMETTGLLGQEKAWGKHGRQLAVINMENQNAAVDNQKLLIMGKRNENAHTINVFALMENLGLDNDGISINGQEYSYASLFLAQPILRRYAELMDYYNSTTLKTYEKITDLIQDQLIKEFGEGVEWAKDEEGKDIKGVLDKTVKYGSEKQRVTGVVDSLTSENLYGQLMATGGNFQWTVFEHFLQLNSKVKEVNKLQQMLNIENKGIGLSFFDTITIKNTLLDLPKMNKSISNVSSMVGDFQSLKTQSSTFKEDSKRLEDNGYTYIDTKPDGTAVYIKPETFFGHKIVNTIATGYNLWKNIMPYESPFIEQQINDIFSEVKINPDTKAGGEYKVKIIQAMKDYMFLYNQQLFKENGESVESNRKKLFMDTEDNISLPALLNELKRRKDPLMDEAFFKNLEFEINRNDEPSIMKYNVSDNTRLIKNQAYRTLKNLINSEEVLVSGIQRGDKVFYQNYTKGDLIKDLLKYALIADQANGAIGFRQHLPLSLFDDVKLSDGTAANITSTLRILAGTDSINTQNVIYNGDIYSLYALMGVNNLNEDNILVNNNGIDYETIVEYVERINDHLGEGTAIIVNKKDVQLPHSKEDLTSNFVRQYIQHHPQDVRALSRKELNAVKSKMSKEEKNNIGKIAQITLPKEYLNRKFVTIKEGNNLYLFENISGSTFKRLNTLGTFGMNEYETGKRVNKSLVKTNNIQVPLEKQLDKTPQKITLRGKEITATKAESAVEVLDKIGKSDSKYKHLANLFLRYVPKDTLINYTDGLAELNYQGVYSEGKIFISNTLPEDIQEEAILEEVLHRITRDIIVERLKITPMGNTVQIDKSIDDAVTTKLASVYKAGYEAIYKELSKRLGEEKAKEVLNQEALIDDSVDESRSGLYKEEYLAYRASSIEEFLAGMFFNPDFAKILNETEYKKSGKSITKNFIDAILRLFKALFPGMELNKDSVLNETTEVMIELLENSYKGGAKSTKKSAPIISKKMVENDAVAKGLVDKFSSTQVEKPSSNEFT
ncbi:MAG TPA: hypothetical protein PLG47_00310, partial [Candidatus Dojkabacteria bacterium]|nr:hypothetical protein [Candidatus Dojkabacteria bacterium]